MSNSGVEARRKRKEWRQERAQKGGLTPKSLKQSEAVPTVDGERPSTQAAESEPSTSAQDLRPRSSPTPLSATPIRRHEHMDFTTMDKATDVDLAYEDAATQTEQLDKQLKEQEEAIGFLRQQVRNRDAMITALRRQLEEKMAPPMEKPLSPNDLDALEERVDDLKSFLFGQERMRGFLSKKPKAHLLLSHFVPFAREHKFLGLLDEQGDEALHSVWRRLEQLWKCMPDADQILQQLEHHFVNNWLLDTGKIDEMKQRQSDQREEHDEFDQSEEETDEISLINVTD
ncbi:hypothetical protein niasHT_023258 [Heterodera trifolii]|uniref:Uncharacterized protein n=1 Tax=Heterodera trifolii TaxID=157864 RepID=A0ABD2JDH8_9BILA